MDKLLTEIQVSEALQVSLACLRRWRLRGEGPQYIKVGPLVRYRPQDLDEWIAALPTGGNGCRFPVVHPIYHFVAQSWNHVGIGIHRQSIGRVA
jgi:predicted DNA-binding transcriptional regulator AlpA